MRAVPDKLRGRVSTTDRATELLGFRCLSLSVPKQLDRSSADNRVTTYRFRTFSHVNGPLGIDLEFADFDDRLIR